MAMSNKAKIAVFAVAVAVVAAITIWAAYQGPQY